MTQNDLQPTFLRGEITLEAPAAESKRRKFAGLAYGGGVVKKGGKRLVIDCADARPMADRLPSLLDHEPSKRAGHCSLTFGNQIRIDSGLLLENEHGKAIAQDSDDGFPWQMSIGVQPGEVQEVAKGQKVSVNGQSFDGPLLVFRKNEIFEVSFVPIGADTSTSAQVFNRSTDEAQTMTPEEIAKLQADNLALTTRLTALETDKATAEATAARLKADAEKAAKERRDADLVTLAKDLGRDLSDAEKTELSGLSDSTFGVIAGSLRAAAKKNPTDPTLLRHTATAPTTKSGAPVDLKSANSIVDAARVYLADQEKLGRSLTVADAVSELVTLQRESAAV
jgi:hypothetical protein